ncbi:MAG: Rrf2 family transcriptional regulator [Rhodospirillaceae bacterium]|nr:Rrf2 family transcriptional regulator [Rhodospirillaceae bacterium]
MRLTQFSDYSLRLLLYLSQHQDRSVTIAEVADWYGVSKAHLVKVAHRLVRRGYIASTRGKGGGLRLGKPAEAINIADLVRDTEPDFHTVECFDRARGTCRITQICTLKHVLHGATDAFFSVLGRHSLADIANPIISQDNMKRRSSHDNPL